MAGSAISAPSTLFIEALIALGAAKEDPPGRTTMKVLIVGGGIGGLVTALELEKVGIESHVFEAVREVRPLGVGLNLPPYATKNLMRLGLGDALIEAGLQTIADGGRQGDFG
jgi:NADPH-dependent 2,4-dienoyl-CoA reductase/sulfur reductase-like enzyme